MGMHASAYPDPQKGRNTTMSSQTPPPSPGDTSIFGLIMHIRQLQADMRNQPVKGSWVRVKKIFYKIIHSAFSRQHNLNSATVDLIEKVYRELRANNPVWQPQLNEQATPPSVHSQPYAVPSPVPVAQKIVPAPQVNWGPVAEVEVGVSSGETLASCGQTQDQAKLNNIRPLSGFASVYSAPAEMRMTERVALYSLVFGIQPRNVLELGTFRGGSTAIICGAMDDTGFGQIACVEPTPVIAPELWARISHRCRMFEGLSPSILPEVARQIRAPFDLVLIDASHAYEDVRRDAESVLPYLADNAYVLFHDANHTNVKRAIDETCQRFSELSDCGLISSEPTVLYENGQRVTWAGLRLLKFKRPMGQVKAA